MERRPLDFNAPLLSARRYTSPRNSSELVQFDARPPPSRRTSLPVNKSEWESADITKPASIPFNWEQTPGRPKPESRFPTPKPPPGRFNSCEIPRLPPGRISGPSRYQSGDRSNDNITTIYTDHALLLQKLNDSLNCRDDSDSSETESEEDEYAHSDALNTVSLTETCSDSKPKHSGKFCVDKQTADFMMSRFLPAAKAAVLETPKKKVIGEKPKEVKKIINEKPVEVTERPKEVRKVVSGEILTKQLIMRQYGSDVLPSYFKHPDFDNVESDDEEHSIVVPVKKSGRSSWGINIPRMCVNLKNPIPSMMSKSRPQTPSRVDDRRFRRNAVSGPLDKSGSQVPPKKKFYSGLISSHGLENNNNNNSNRSSNGPSQHLLNSPNRSGLSPLRRYRSGNISPYRNESPKSAFREGAGFLGLPSINNKEDASKIASSRKMFRALQEVSRTNPVEEKTVYVDSISRRTVKPKQEEEGKTMGSKYSDEAKDVKMYQSYGQELRGMGLQNKDTKLELKGGEKLVDSYIGRDLPLKSRGMGLREKDVKGEKLDDSYIVGERDDLHLPVKSPLPPPLPKSPSESWLWRTLPSIPLGNPFSHSHRNNQIHSKKQGRKDDAKWETIVKTSNGRHDHARYSEEHMPHLSYRQSKS